MSKRRDRTRFTEVWNSSASVKEVAERLGVLYQRSLSIYAAKLRREGYELKRFPPGTLSPYRNGR